MPLDAYSLCPCGTGKKIKFCCPDLLHDLEKISRMIEGDQNLAALLAIETAEAKYPARASLMALKGPLLRQLGRIDQARANAAAFLEKHPDNPVALAESAVLTTLKQGSLEALPLLLRALKFQSEGLLPRVYDAMRVLCSELLRDGHWLPARQLLRMDLAFNSENEQAVKAMVELQRSPRIPLLIKDPPPVVDTADEAPAEAGFAEVRARMDALDLIGAAERLAELAEESGEPSLWQKAGVMRGYLGQVRRSQEALRKYAAMDVPLDDAVEAEGLAMLQDDDPFGDAIDVLLLSWKVQDVERLQTALTLDRRAQTEPVDPSPWAQSGSPPPKMGCSLLDRPLPSSPAELSEEQMPLMLGRAFLFGRQTDREAEFQVAGVRENQRDALVALLQETAGDCLSAEPEQEVIDSVSATYEQFQPRWYPPEGVSPQEILSLSQEAVRRSLLQQWPERPLGVLDGKTPREAAADQRLHARLLAVIQVLRTSMAGDDKTADLEVLRSQLGLPELGPIDPAEVDIATLPLVRLSRLMVDKATDEQLAIGFKRAASYGASEAIQRLGREWTQRPSFATDPNRLFVYHQLAQSASTPDEALQYIAAGRQALPESGRGACAAWDLMELPVRITQQHGQAAVELIQHIAQNHMKEPGVQEAFAQTLMQFGLLGPDGRVAMPTAGMGDGAGETPDGEPASGQAGTIWTPGSDQPGGEKKLWTPD